MNLSSIILQAGPRSIRTLRHVCLLAPASAAIGLCIADAALAQTALPEIVVTAASPVVRRPAPRPAPTQVAASQQAPTTPSALEPVTAPDTFVPVSVITQDRIETSTVRGSLGDVLFDLPGVTGSSFAPGAASRPVIRGLDNARVRIQENGIGAHDVSEIGEDHGVTIDPLAAERIEVIRGPATLRWGSQAIGGVVSVTNNRIPDWATPYGLSGNVRGGFSSVDKATDGAVIVEGRGKTGAFHADIYGRNAEDYAVPGGVQRNTHQKALGGAVGASYLFEGGYVGAAIIHNAAVYGIPGIDGEAEDARIAMKQTKIMSKGEFRPNSKVVDTIRFWLGGSGYRHDEIAFSDTDGLIAPRATFRNREYEARIETQFNPVQTAFGALTTAIGATGGHQQLGTSGEAGSLLAPAKTTNAAGYIFNELDMPHGWRVQTAGRLEHVAVSGTASEFPPDFLGGGAAPIETDARRSFLPGSVSLGVLKDLPHDMIASLTMQYVQRAPRAQELFSKGPHEASGTFEIGNANLTKESARTIEAGLRKTKGPWRFDVTAYHTRFSNFIYKNLTGVQCDDEFDTCGNGGTELDQVLFAQRDARFTGAEFSTQLDIAPIAGGMFGVDAQYDTVRATFADGSNVPRIPPQRLGSGAYWRGEAWYARVGLLHAFAQTHIAAEETTTGGYDLLKAELSHTVRPTRPGSGIAEARFGIVGTNLLNDEVRNHVSFRKDEVLLPGRGVRVFADVKF